MSAAFCFFTAIFAGQIIHEYVHVWQLRPYKPEEIIILGWKQGEEWGGKVKGRFDLTSKSERRQELEAHIIGYTCMYAIMLPYMLMLLKGWGM